MAISIIFALVIDECGAIAILAWHRQLNNKPAFVICQERLDKSVLKGIPHYAARFAYVPLAAFCYLRRQKRAVSTVEVSYSGGVAPLAVVCQVCISVAFVRLLFRSGLPFISCGFAAASAATTTVRASSIALSFVVYRTKVITRDSVFN